MFPKVLPRAALRQKKEGIVREPNKISFAFVVATTKRLLTNKVYFCNTMAGAFYLFGYMPFQYFQSKYIQIHFLFSASTANLITGPVALVFSAIGLLSAAIYITIMKPRARSLALWNIVTSVFSVCGILSYGLFSCTAESNSIIVEK